MTTLVIHNAQHHGMYYTDLERRPIQLSVQVLGTDCVVSLPPRARIAVHACVGLPGYGYVWVTADNAGKGYSGGSLDLASELLDSQLACCRAVAKRYGQRIDLAHALELAEQKRHAEALAATILAGEDVVLACARNTLARRQGSIAPLISSTLFDCGPSWLRLDPEHKPGILRPAEQWEMVAAVFDSTVLPCFWGWIEHERGNYRWQPLDRIAAFAAERGMTLKSFAIFWGGSLPPWFKALGFEEQLAAIERWATDLIKRYRGQVRIWEFVNEVHDWKFANPMQWSHEQLLRVTRLVSELVATLDPGVPRVINHCLVWGNYVQSSATGGLWSPLTFLEDAIAADIPFEGIGLQWIFHTGLKDARHLLECALHLERFIGLGKDIYLTEMGVPSSSHPRDQSVAPADGLDGWRGPWSPERQADWVEYWYTIAASYPQVKFMNWWDFADGNEFILNGGMVDRKGRAKPAYRRLQELCRRYRLTAQGQQAR